MQGALDLEAGNRLVQPLPDLLAAAPPSWRPLVDDWRASPPGRRLVDFVEGRRQAGASIYPARVLRALELTPREAVRVVILGQDPYHGAGQAEGLAFSVPERVTVPPSLRNIGAELLRDLGVQRSVRGHLGGWAAQGVLLLNTALTVEDGRPGSHAKHGWEALTDAMVVALAEDASPKVFLLWGAHAQAKLALVQAAAPGRHAVLCANHPSPLSARRGPVPFIGCGHFGEANRRLRDWYGPHAGIDWAR